MEMELGELQYMEVNLMMKISNCNMKLVVYQWPMLDQIQMEVNSLLLQQKLIGYLISYYIVIVGWKTCRFWAGY